MRVAKTGTPVIFRPTLKNRERLDYAKLLGLEMAQVINDVLDKHLRDYLTKEAKPKVEKLQEALSAPVP